MNFKHYLFFLSLLSVSNLFSQVDILEPFPPALGASIQICVGETIMECGEALVDFGEQIINTQGTQQVVIKNTGNLTVIITDFGLSGSSAFSLDTDPELGIFLIVPKGGQAVLDIHFSPAIVGLHQAQLSIDYLENLDGPCIINFSGLGINDFQSSCLAITYSTNHGASWNPVSCGDEVYIDLTNTSNAEFFPLRYVVQNNCDAPLTLSGETALTWTNTAYTLNPTLLTPGQSVQHSAGFTFLPPGNIYTYATTFTTDGASNPETCEITITVDKQMGFDSGIGNSGKQLSADKPIIFPTIATEAIYLKLNTDASANFVIYDLKGKQIKQGKTDNFTTTISIIDLAPGAYFMKIEDHPEALRFVVRGK